MSDDRFETICLNAATVVVAAFTTYVVAGWSSLDHRGLLVLALVGVWVVRLGAWLPALAGSARSTGQH
ncbi:hypothetical protein [Nocardioides pacificus]